MCKKLIFVALFLFSSITYSYDENAFIKDFMFDNFNKIKQILDKDSIKYRILNDELIVSSKNYNKVLFKIKGLEEANKVNPDILKIDYDKNLITLKVNNYKKTIDFLKKHKIYYRINKKYTISIRQKNSRYTLFKLIALGLIDNPYFFELDNSKYDTRIFTINRVHRRNV